MEESMSEEDIQNIAAAFVEARRSATPLGAFPGDLPETLEQAWKSALGVIQSDLPLLPQGVLEKGGTIALVGPTGVRPADLLQRA